MKKAKVTKINETTYRFTEAAFGTDVYMYLLIGEKSALLIDTAYGFTDVPSAIKKITDLPLTVVNTHGHMDHIHGNHFYDQVHVSEADSAVFERHCNASYLMSLVEQVAEENRIPKILLKLPMLNVKGVVTSYPSVRVPLPEQMYFELGSRRVEILPTPGHTAGSVCFLDVDNHWLFAGDTACHDGVLLNFPESTNVGVFRESIQKLIALAEEGKIHTLYPSHQDTPQSVDLLYTYKDACDMILSNSISKEEFDAGSFTYHGLTVRFDNQRIGGMQ